MKAQIKRKTNKNFLKDLDRKLGVAVDRLCDFGKQSAIEKLGGTESDIDYSVIETKEGYQGKIFTNFEGPAFVEYGTGRRAEMPHIGKTYTFRKTGYYFWYAPADKVKRNYKDTDYFEFNGEMYPMNAYMDNTKYVMVFESNPRPFMRPAVFEIETNARKIIKDTLGGK